MTLSDLYDNRTGYSDKGSNHTYIKNYYEKEFTDREGVRAFLEIGIFHGASLILWNDWFPNAIIDGIEYSSEYLEEWERTKSGREFPRIKYNVADAYAVSNLYKDDHYDYIVDDGPHDPESQVLAIDLYLKKVKPGGKLIIEDIPNDERFEQLEEAARSNDLECTTKRFVFNIANRFDDMIFEITRL